MVWREEQRSSPEHQFVKLSDMKWTPAEMLDLEIHHKWIVLALRSEFAYSLWMKGTSLGMYNIILGGAQYT